MNLIFQAVFHVSDETNPQEMLQTIGEFLNQSINEESALGEEVRLYGLEFMNAVKDGEGKRVFLYNLNMLEDGDAYLSMKSNNNSDEFIHIIRVPVEGIESHRDRFDIMDEAIKSMGADPDEEMLNVFFVFDSGTPESFSKLAVPLIIKPDSDLLYKAKTEGITFCQWFSRDERENRLKDIEEQVKNSKDRGDV